MVICTESQNKQAQKKHPFQGAFFVLREQTIYALVRISNRAF